MLRQLVSELDVDLVVLGTQGHKGLGKLFLGSVAEEVLRTVPVPVLTIGPGATRDIVPEMPIRTILYATDFSEPAERALPYALSIAQEHDACLVLLHVMSPSARVVEPIGKIIELLAQLVPADAVPWCKPEYVAEFGPVAERILQVADLHRTNLIVLGARGTGGLARAVHFLGSTVQQIIGEAHCPVLTVRG